MWRYHVFLWVLMEFELSSTTFLDMKKKVYISGGANRLSSFNPNQSSLLQPWLNDNPVCAQKECLGCK
jgi:hypothetical protein